MSRLAALGYEIYRFCGIMNIFSIRCVGDFFILIKRIIWSRIYALRTQSKYFSCIFSKSFIFS